MLVKNSWRTNPTRENHRPAHSRNGHDSSRLKGGLSLLELNGLLLFGFGFCGPSGPFECDGETSMPFDICRVARNCFLVAGDGIRDLTFEQTRAAGVGRKRCALPVYRDASKFGGLLPFRRSFRGSA